MDKFILLKRNEGRMNIREKYPALHKPFRRRANTILLREERSAALKHTLAITAAALCLSR
jgi:hypothetical protein